MKTFVHLGRYGDIINTLPLLHHHAALGESVQQVVCWRYASVLEGVSYVRARPYPNEFADLMPAIAMAKQLDPAAVNLQVSGTGWVQPRSRTSFLLEQWANAGMAHAWDTLPLVFDRRDAVREELLWKRTTGNSALPVVLVASHGFSSPFAYGADLLGTLRERLVGKALVVDLSGVVAERVYDLLCLFDRAACLVTIDTMHMHLARGSSVPVVALANDTHTPWHQSAKRVGQVWYGTYTQYASRKEELLAAVEAQVPTRQVQRTVAPAACRRCVHVYPMHPMNSEALRRHHTAKASWQRDHGEHWQDLPYHDPARSATGLGDARDLPYVHDLMEAACAAAGPDGVVVLSNSDACMADGAGAEIERLVAQHGACFTHRWDFPHPVAHVRKGAVAHGKWYPGSDLFAFSTAWWRQHGHEYPDMLMGAEYVDAVLRQLIKKHCGTLAEGHLLVFHEMHDSAWKGDRHSPAALYNARLARAWFKAHGCDDLDPFGVAAAERIRAQRGTPLYAIA